MDFLSQSQMNLTQLSVLELLIRFVLALVLSGLAGGVYLYCRREPRESRVIVYAGVGLSLVITMILLVLSSNLFYALGLFAALSIIRFRTPVKHAHDTVHLFLCIGIGIACGAGAIKVALVGTVFLLSIQVIYSSLSGDHWKSLYLIRVFVSKGFSQQKELEAVLAESSKSFEVTQIHRSPDGGEYFYHLHLKKKQAVSELIERLTGVEKVSEVTILPAQKDSLLS